MRVSFFYLVLILTFIFALSSEAVSFVSVGDVPSVEGEEGGNMLDSDVPQKYDEEEFEEDYGC